MYLVKGLTGKHKTHCSITIAIGVAVALQQEGLVIWASGV